jgi:hypothetical protein
MALFRVNCAKSTSRMQRLWKEHLPLPFYFGGDFGIYAPDLIFRG